MRRWAFATACGFASCFQIGAENEDIVGSHQSLWGDYQSEARIESHRETIVGKGGARLGRMFKKSVQQGRRRVETGGVPSGVR